MNDEQIRRVQNQLDGYASFNQGEGLIVTNPLAKALRRNGITGPYQVAKPLPKPAASELFTRRWEK